MTEHRARVTWQRGQSEFTYEAYPRDHQWIFEGGIEIAASAAPGFLGSADRVDPEEAFVASLSSCHMLTFLAIAAKRRFTVDAYADDAVGFLEKDDEGKLAMTQMMDIGSQMLGTAFPGMDMFSGQSQDPTKILEAMEEIYSFALDGKETFNNEEVFVITGELKSELPDDLSNNPNAAIMAPILDAMKSFKLRIGTEDGFVRSVQMPAADDDVFSSTIYKNLVFNEPMDDNLFVYTPPDGVPVLDMTEMASAVLDGADSADDEYAGNFGMGEMPPDFEATGLDGATIKLSDYKGKVVFLDFWATWCGPCIQELPNVIEGYETFHDQGFEIIGISLDDEREALDKFLTSKPAMTWPQIFDGKGWDAEVGKIYGVEAIPYTLLLDQEGKIVAKDLRGSDLSDKLPELLAK